MSESQLILNKPESSFLKLNLHKDYFKHKPEYDLSISNTLNIDRNVTDKLLKRSNCARRNHWNTLSYAETKMETVGNNSEYLSNERYSCNILKRKDEKQIAIFESKPESDFKVCNKLPIGDRYLVRSFNCYRYKSFVRNPKNQFIINKTESNLPIINLKKESSQNESKYDLEYEELFPDSISKLLNTAFDDDKLHHDILDALGGNYISQETNESVTAISKCQAIKNESSCILSTVDNQIHSLWTFKNSALPINYRYLNYVSMLHMEEKYFKREIEYDSSAPDKLSSDVCVSEASFPYLKEGKDESFTGIVNADRDRKHSNSKKQTFGEKSQSNLQNFDWDRHHLEPEPKNDFLKSNDYYSDFIASAWNATVVSQKIDKSLNGISKTQAEKTKSEYNSSVDSQKKLNSDVGKKHYGYKYGHIDLHPSVLFGYL